MIKSIIHNARSLQVLSVSLIILLLIREYISSREIEEVEWELEELYKVAAFDMYIAGITSVLNSVLIQHTQNLFHYNNLILFGYDNSLPVEYFGQIVQSSVDILSPVLLDVDNELSQLDEISSKLSEMIAKGRFEHNYEDESMIHEYMKTLDMYSGYVEGIYNPLIDVVDDITASLVYLTTILRDSTVDEDGTLILDKSIETFNDYGSVKYPILNSLKRDLADLCNTEE